MTPIHIVEVGPRDGLQNEKGWVPTEAKIGFVDQLSASGLTEIEVSSFVAPGWIPQLDDAAKVFAGITRRSGVRYTALVPNQRGLARAMEAGVDGISVFTAASETFARKNINASIAESIERFRPVVRESTVPVRGYISTAFHCPFEGKIDPAQVVAVALQLIEVGCSELSLGDTIGKATADEVRALIAAIGARVPLKQIALHLHDTYGNAVANAEAGAALGISIFDGSAGGLGGCPYAPGAPGNVATEALVSAFAGRTGVDGARLADAARTIRPFLGQAATSPTMERSSS